MKKTVWTFGLLSGAVASALMIATTPFIDQVGYDHGLIVGYTGIVASFLLVYFGIRSYRDNVAGGTISFGRAFSVGILIALVSCACYVITWEIIYYNFMPDFADKYAAHTIAKLRASGAPQAAIDAQIAGMKHYKELLANPLYNAAMTFIEPFPVGLVMTLISAAILRGRRKERVAQGWRTQGASGV